MVEKAAVERAMKRSHCSGCGMYTTCVCEPIAPETLDAGEDYEATLRRNAVAPVAPGFKVAK
jgi:hypothetical protein